MRAYYRRLSSVTPHVNYPPPVVEEEGWGLGKKVGKVLGEGKR